MRVRSVNRLVADLAKWVARPSNRELLHEEPKRLLELYVAGHHESPFARLSQHAIWDGNYGAHLVLTNDPTGWALIQRSFLYAAWDARVLFAELDIRIAKAVALAEVPFPLTHAICVREDAFAGWLGNCATSFFEANDRRLWGWGDGGPFEPFAVKLFALWRGYPLDYVGRDIGLGVYQCLLDCWESESEFGKALRAVCDYHVEQAFDDRQDDPQDFFKPLYKIFPVEILAIKRIREEQGLPMPEIDHPLMQTPLAHPPDVMPTVEDELLNQVIAKVRKELPIGDPW